MNERINIADKKPKTKSQNSAPQIRRKTESSQSMNSPVDRILFLQRTIGNQAVGKLIKSEALQAKLRIGQPWDVYEQEADRVAEQVMRMPEPAVQSKPVESHINSLQDGGQPLPGSVIAFFEPRFGHDFSRVRAHYGGAAEQSARDVNANAYTAGHNIVFGVGKYAPGTREGRFLIAHELTHVVQQSEADRSGKLRRQPTKPEDDPIHQPIIEQYRREEGLPESGIDPQTGQPVGPSPAEIKYGSLLGDVATPKKGKPSLATVPEALPLASCGTVTPGMDPAKAEPIRDCIVHTRFVNFMKQSIANMEQVASPYAPGIAAMYKAAHAEVVKAGLTNLPTAKAPKKFIVNNLTVAVSPGVTLPIASFDLTLQRVPGGANGVNFGSGVELNEESGAALMQDQADMERTMYHEGFHWLSGEVSAHNRSVRGGAKGSVVRSELDYAFVQGFETEFRAAAEPIWKDALATVPLKMTLSKPPTPQGFSGIQWIKVANEILSRVEEAVYMNLRQGKGFSRRSDLPALAQGWLLTSDYWDSGVIFVRADLQSFLTKNTDRVNRELLPVVQKIQREYLRRRATP